MFAASAWSATAWFFNVVRALFWAPAEASAVAVSEPRSVAGLMPMPPI